MYFEIKKKKLSLSVWLKNNLNWKKMVSYCLPKNCTNYTYKHQMVDVKISLSFLNNGKIKNRKGEKWYHSSIYLYKNKQSISSRKYKISYYNKTQSKLNNYHLNIHYESCYTTGVHLKYFIRKPNICVITWYYSSLNIAHSYFFVKRSDISKLTKKICLLSWTNLN